MGAVDEGVRGEEGGVLHVGVVPALADAVLLRPLVQVDHVEPEHGVARQQPPLLGEGHAEHAAAARLLVLLRARAPDLGHGGGGQTGGVHTHNHTSYQTCSF